MADSTWFYENFEHTGSAIGFRTVRKLDEVQSPFQKIEIFETTDFGNLMVIDGAMMVSTRENFFYHEMMSHAAIFTHAAPKDIVIIGGGDCGTLRECLKHAEVETVVQCDIDEQVTRMAEKYFPELCESNNDPRATVMFDDGIAYMAAAEPESIDIIIVDSTDPVGPAEGLFNRAFYETCFKALRPEGLLVQQSESPLALMNLIQDMIAAMADAGFRGFRTLPFPQPCYPTGWWSCTIAAKNGRDLTTFRNDAAAGKTFRTEYYNAGIHHGALLQPELLKRALKQS
ncbi:polyamine aminopropyltransferase [Arenimonas sp.]|uniref:polyamine aminopropyltransferase n=1 Tax=Arenimonas sp. TaxID=1872635 RepID=UPI0037BFBCD2